MDRPLRILARFLEGEGCEVQLEDELLRVGGHTIGVTAHAEQEQDVHGKLAVGVIFRVSLDGKEMSALNGGVVGIGDDRTGALNNATESWVGYFGRPLMGGLLQKQAPDASEGPYWVYVGPQSIRGKLSDEEAQRVCVAMERAQRAVSRSIAARYPQAVEWIGITMMLAFQPNGRRCSINCQQNGTQMHDYDSAIMDSVEWPDCSTSCLCKQFFLITPKPVDGPRCQPVV